MLSELQYIELPGPTNVYGSTSFKHEGRLKLCVAALNQVILIHSNDTIDGNIRWSTIPLSLSNITTDIQIISIDCTSEELDIRGSLGDIQSEIQNRSNLAVAVHRQQGNESLFFLYIYTANTSTTSDPSYLFSTDCQVISLGYIPFKIGHVRISHKRSRCFLVSGSDRFHLYQQDTTKHQYVEINVADCFPSLSNVSSGLSFDIRFFQSGNLSVVGCQDGSIHFGSNETTIGTSNFDGPVSSVQLFGEYPDGQHCHTEHPAIQDLRHTAKKNAPLSIFTYQESVNLLASDAIGSTYVFKNVMQSGLKDKIMLPPIENMDAVTCCTVVDIDFDGKNEVIVGTYANEILVYKEKDLGFSPVLQKKVTEFEIVYRKKLPRPVMALFWEDICNDGMDNLIVVTATGVHVLQPDLEVAKERLLRVMNRVKEIRNLELLLEQENKLKEQFSTILHRFRLPSVASLEQVADTPKLPNTSQPSLIQ